MKKNLIVLLITISISSIKAQFNTIRHIQPTKTETVDAKKIEPPTQINEKKQNNPFIRLFNATSKTQLKKEIDSLKKTMNELRISNKQKSNYYKIRDSLFHHFEERFTKLVDTGKPQQQFVNTPVISIKTPQALSMPLRNRLVITSPYGIRHHPIFGTIKMHNGIDIKANFEDVFSVMDGVVTQTGWDPKGGGNFIKVRHLDRFETAYLHLSKIYNMVGDRVSAGTIIAKSGNTGNSTGPHLHFIVREFGRTINPLNFLDDLKKVNNLININNERTPIANR